MSVRVSGSDHDIPTHLSILQSYLFSRAYPVRCSLFPVQSTSRPATALYLRSKTPHINPAASAMQTSGQINVNFLLGLTCQEPQTERMQTGLYGTFWTSQAQQEWQQRHDGIQASRELNALRWMTQFMRQDQTERISRQLGMNGDRRRDTKWRLVLNKKSSNT